LTIKTERMKTELPGFWQYAEQNPKKIAVVEPGIGERTFGELLSNCNRLSHALRDRGLSRGDAIGVMLPNCATIFEIYFAAMQSGVYYTAINHYLAPPEIAYVLENSEAKLLFIHEQYRAQIEAALGKSDFEAGNCIWLSDDTAKCGYSALLSDYPDHLPETRPAGQTMLYSSGTSGRPKGIRPPLPELPPDDYMIARGWMVEQFGFRVGDGTHLLNGPMHHSGPLSYAAVSMHFGHTIVITGKWDAENALRFIERYKVSTTFMVPTMFSRILALPQDIRSQYDLGSLEAVIHAAAPCPVPVKQAMIEWLGPIIYETYGGTEGAGTSCNSEQWLKKPGTVGPPAPGMSLKVLDDNGNEVPTGEVGLVYLASTPGLGLPSYFKDEEKTTASRRDEFYTIGDMGRVDENGWLFLVDRQSDMIISGGVNIYPAEIEQALVQHAAIEDVAVIGLPNEEWGEEVKAVIKLGAGYQASDELTEDIKAFCAANLAKYKHPRSIDYIDELPRADNGKFYKRRLKEQYLAAKTAS